MTRSRAAVAAFVVALAMACAHAETEAPAADPAAEWTYHVVDGDTLIGLTAAFLTPDVSWRQLQRLNRVADPLHLVPGAPLRIPLAWLRRTATVAEVIFVQGDVTLLREGQADGPLGTEMRLRAGDTVRTGAQSSTTLRFGDGSRLLVTPDSQVTIEQLLVYGRSEIPGIGLRLDRGGADSKVVPNAAGAPAYRIRTPAVNLGVRGTEFRAHAAVDGASRLEVLDGRVAAGTAQRELPVAAGFGTVAEPGQAPQPPRALLEAPDLAGVPALAERVPLAFGWPALAGAGAYRAQVLDIGGGDRLRLDGRFDAAAARWADLPDGRYVLRVRGIDAAGLEGRDAERSFVLKARPEPPFTTGPEADARLHGASVRFSWAHSADAQRYRLQVFAEDDLANPVIDRSDLGATELDLALPPGRYRWRVATIAAGEDQGPFGDLQGLTLSPEPPPPPVEPPERTPSGLTLRWRAPAPGEQVQVQVANDADFQRIVLDQRTEAPQILLPDPKPGSYYLRTRTIDASGYAGQFGSVQRVDVSLSKWWLLIPAGFLWLLL